MLTVALNINHQVAVPINTPMRVEEMTCSFAIPSVFTPTNANSPRIKNKEPGFESVIAMDEKKSVRCFLPVIG